ncbi:SWIM zinc finger family protein [Lacrimispora sp. 38-1]|uniref:SWIM zinc finger family protein n=1 Tax=Lacrimispora sp. 38-1 TaxID=3125778 RepID=UPI003CE9DF92
MSILSIASNASAWRGYEYYEGKRVISWNQMDKHEFEGTVRGSGKEPYHVMIDTEHPKKSTCNCPHAEGKRIVCKHKIALFFTVFPKEADRYIAEIEEYEREEGEREQEHYDQIVRYVKSLSKEELRTALINALIEAEERDRYR